MSTHNICFHQEIRKILCGYPLLSVAMRTTGHKHMLSQLYEMTKSYRQNSAQIYYGNTFIVNHKPIFCDI